MPLDFSYKIYCKLKSFKKVTDTKDSLSKGTNISLFVIQGRVVTLNVVSSFFFFFFFKVIEISLKAQCAT
jgi:hypothetical protein